jgi:hypothetical protein
MWPVSPRFCNDRTVQYPQKVLTDLLKPVTSFVYAIGCSTFFIGSYVYVDDVY